MWPMNSFPNLTLALVGFVHHIQQLATTWKILHLTLRVSGPMVQILARLDTVCRIRKIIRLSTSKKTNN